MLITETGEQTLPGKINLILAPGSRLSIRTPGGWGWGEENIHHRDTKDTEGHRGSF